MPNNRVSSRVVDALLAVTVAVVLATVMTLSETVRGAVPGVPAYLFAAGFGAVLLLRRRLPVVTLVLSVLGVFVYYMLELPTIGVAVPVVAALFSAAEAGLLRWAVGAGAVVFAVSLHFRLRDDPQPVGYLLGYDAVANLALIAAAIALGYAVRTNRVRTAQQEQITRLTEEQLTREADLRTRSEREQISRELHDTVGHALSVISLHAGVAAESIGTDDRAAAAAVGEVKKQAGGALQELRAMVRVLRQSAGDEADAADRGVRSLADVGNLLDRARATGLKVTAHIDVDAGVLPAAVDFAAYRVIQESLTNVIRHAEARTVQVSAVLDDGRLHVTVRDDGRGAEVDRTSGVGIVGMTERVRLLGGRLDTVSSPGGGFTVDAVFPATLAS